MTKLFAAASLFFAGLVSYSQEYFQSFDGQDTIPMYSVQVVIDSSSANIWQIGPPQKTIFHSPASAPNVLVTDTINTYPDSAHASVYFGVPLDAVSWSYALAIQWVQKIDLDSVTDGALVEYSTDTGTTWINCHNDPNVFNFYGWNWMNYDTLQSTGEPCFTGQDTLWKNVWLCFEESFINTIDTLMVRFTIKSDSINQMRDGWMIDNLYIHPTWFHTVVENSGGNNYKVFPTVSDGIFNIVSTENRPENHINSLEVISADGRVVQRFEDIDYHYKLDLSFMESGTYYIKISAETFSETYTVFLEH